MKRAQLPLPNRICFRSEALIMLLLLLSSHLFAQGSKQQQSNSQEEIIGSCLINDVLGGKVPDYVRSNMENYRILNEGISFDISQGFQINEKDVVLISRNDLQKEKSHFVFNVMDIKEDKALVQFDWVYYEVITKRSISYDLTFVKSDLGWVLLNDQKQAP